MDRRTALKRGALDRVIGNTASSTSDIIKPPAPYRRDDVGINDLRVRADDAIVAVQFRDDFSEAGALVVFGGIPVVSVQLESEN